MKANRKAINKARKFKQRMLVTAQSRANRVNKEIKARQRREQRAINKAKFGVD